MSSHRGLGSRPQMPAILSGLMRRPKGGGGGKKAEAPPVIKLKSPREIGLMRDGSVRKLRKRLRGDLDNIVLMALRKEPQRRYSSRTKIHSRRVRRTDWRDVLQSTYAGELL